MHLSHLYCSAEIRDRDNAVTLDVA
jgi:hypothetical protein